MGRAALLIVIGVVVAFAPGAPSAAPSLIPAAAAGSNRATRANGESLIAFTGRRGISVMDADGTGVRLLIARPHAEDPAWSPDGRKLAFDTLAYRQGDIYVANADGSEVQRLTHLGDAAAPAWSPDSRSIAFGTGGTLEVMHADGSDPRTLLRGNWSGSAAAPSWSPDGRQIAFSYSGPPGYGFGIAVINTDGSGLRKLTNRRGGNIHVYDSAPRWSPDGKHIAYYQEFDCACDYSDPCMHPFDVFVMNANGSGIHQLTDNCISENPSWSPSGTEIAYDTFTQVHVMSAYGRDRRRLTTGRHGGWGPAWSPAR